MRNHMWGNCLRHRNK
ncbi:hypothetical protein R5R35_002276 [Gryllus longicercus]|uniref:Uncharacterized protein n=1 Tax=Gryllus longicercus TaxID=2509291 RepID=A0AAN9W529_9ORTH